MKYTCGFIGCGNMGGALLRAAAKAIPAEKIAVTNRTMAKAEAIAAETGAEAVDAAELLRESRFIFLGVKPQMLESLAEDIAPLLRDRGAGFVLVSMAAGVTVERLCSLLGRPWPVIRIMPNTPVSVGEGMVLYAPNELVDGEALSEFLEIMGGAGRLDRLDEGLIDAGSAVSGCGPAFAYMFMEALADGGVQCGLPRDTALSCAAQTLLGSAELLLKSGRHPGALKDAVCSPGGSTIAGVHALDCAGFRGGVQSAVIAAYEKTLALGKPASE